MDTRSKIITVEQALALSRELLESGTPFNVVSGYFDVLQPGWVERLQEYSSEETRLFAVVLNPSEALLPDAARAELVAALRVVDYVIPCGGATDFIQDMKPIRRIQEEASHQESTERLIEDVFQRHSLERKWRTRH
jgi:hypothetical protein